MYKSSMYENLYCRKDLIINKRLILYFLCFLFIIEPKICTQFSIFVYIFSGANLLIFCLYFLKTYKIKSKFTNTLYLWLLFCIYSLLSKLTSGDLSFIFSWGYLALMVSNIIMIFNESYTNNNLIILLKSIILVGIVYLGINLLTLLIFNRGIIRSNFYDGSDGDWYFLGIKTQFPMYVFAFISCAIAYKIITKKNILCLLIFIIGFLNLFISNGTTGIIMYMLMIVLLIFAKIFPEFNISLKTTLFVCIIINVLFVFFNASVLFSNLFLLFEKDATMSSRTSIWYEAKKILFRNPLRLLIGYGSFNNGSWVPINNSFWYSHNFLLQSLHENGIFGLVLLFLFLLYGVTMKKPLYNGIYSKYLRYVNIICIVIIISTITEDIFSTAYTFIPFLLLKFSTCNAYEKGK